MGEKHERFAARRLQSAIERLRKDDPEKYKELKELEKTDPAAFRDQVQKLLRERAQRPGGRIEQDLLCEQLAGEYRNEKDPEKRKQLETDLKVAVQDAFDRRLAQQEEQLRAWEERLRNLKASIDERRGKRQEICEQRFRELLTDPELRW